jgi:hypothetical protein
MYCVTCKRAYKGVCPTHGIVSEVDASLDRMVEAASVPNLASLFSQAKAKGVITPGKEYGEK